MKLENKYTDLRGLKIPDEDIIDLLYQAEKTEKEILDFIGHRECKKKGRFFYFLDTLAKENQFFKRRK